jgi:peptidoglycan biosynthesis protein MviN/MurJ (putative lipid II flippase)
VALTGGLLATYSAAIVGIALKDIVSNALVAMNREWTAVAVGLGSLAVSALLKSVEAVRADPFRIAFSTGVAVWIGAAIFIVVCSLLLPMRWLDIFLSGGWKIAIAGVALAAFCQFFAASTASAAVGLTWSVIVMSCVVYFLTAYVLRFNVMGLKISVPAVAGNGSG